MLTTTRREFRALRDGDTFAIDGETHVAAGDAHYSGDADFNGYIVYDTTGESFFEDEFPEYAHLPSRDPIDTYLWICLYKDSTGKFTEEDCYKDNLIDLQFPECIIAEWYEDHVKDDYDGPGKNSYVYWFRYVSTADDTDGLYQYALERGWDALREED